MSFAADPLPPEDFERLLTARSASLGARLSPASRSALASYLCELDRWRRTTNLTGRLSAGELAEHALEALLAESLVPEGARVVDIGSGGGLPGVALSIARPDLSMRLLEPRRKRAEFLRHVCRSVPLPNASVLEGRAEDLAAGAFDIATCRAVGGLGRVVGAATFLRPGGLLLAWTTDPATLARELDRSFEPAGVLPIPASRQKAIAAFRRRT